MKPLSFNVMAILTILALSLICLLYKTRKRSANRQLLCKDKKSKTTNEEAKDQKAKNSIDRATYIKKKEQNQKVNEQKSLQLELNFRRKLSISLEEITEAELSEEQTKIQLKLQPIKFTPKYQEFRYKIRVGKMKRKYMKIIDILRQKIREKANQFEMSQVDLSIESFHETVDESSLQKQDGLLQALRQQLQLYEQIVTNLLQEERELKKEINQCNACNSELKDILQRQKRQKQQINFGYNSKNTDIGTIQSEENRIKQFIHMFQNDRKSSVHKAQTNSIFSQCRFLNLISKCFISSTIKRLQAKQLSQTRYVNRIKPSEEHQQCGYLWLIKCQQSNFAFYKGKQNDIMIDLSMRTLLRGEVIFNKNKQQIIFNCHRKSLILSGKTLRRIKREQTKAETQNTEGIYEFLVSQLIRYEIYLQASHKYIQQL